MAIVLSCWCPSAAETRGYSPEWHLTKQEPHLVWKEGQLLLVLLWELSGTTIFQRWEWKRGDVTGGPKPGQLLKRLWCQAKFVFPFKAIIQTVYRQSSKLLQKGTWHSAIFKCHDLFCQLFLQVILFRVASEAMFGKQYKRSFKKTTKSTNN